MATTYNLNMRTAYTPDAADALGSISVKSSALTTSQHDETHKYLYTKIATQLITGHTDFTLVGALADKNMLLYNGTAWRNYSMSGDATMDNAGAITVTKINSKTVTLGGAFTTSGAFTTTLTVTGNTNVELPHSGKLLTDALADASIFIGSGAGVATAQAITGAISLTNTGFTAITAGVIMDADINGSALITWTKLNKGTVSRALVTDGSGYITTATTTSTEIGYLNTSTPGTTVASKALVVGASKNTDELTMGNIKISANSIISTNTNGDINITPDGTGNTVIDDVIITTQLDINGLSLIIDADGDTYMKASADDTVTFYVWDGAASTGQINIADGIVQPVTTNDIDLGDGTHEYKQVYTRGITATAALTIDATDIDITGTTTLNLHTGGTGTIVVGDAGDRIGFFGGAGSTKPAALTTQLTTLTSSAPGAPDYAIADLTNPGFGFTTLDEGLTVLSVIENLQTRVSELESRLKTDLGLIS